MKINNPKLAFTKLNYILLSIGFIIILIGLFIMKGGGTEDMNIHNQEEMFGFQRITLAPILIIIGFIINIFAILYSPKGIKGEEYRRIK
tara:strand:+ start:47341 stop:47607 length:267 start_codon:yes stop_codon:yes gene_type:complete